MNLVYPLFGFEKADCSMFLIADQKRIAYRCEAIDIENNEYVFWDSLGEGVCIELSRNRVSGVTRCKPEFPISDAFIRYAESQNVPTIAFSGTPREIWENIQQQLKARPKKPGFLSRFFSK
jgi:hypothetical protein